MHKTIDQALVDALVADAREVWPDNFADIEETTEWEQVQAMVVREDGTVLAEEDTRAFLDGAGLSPRDLARKVASIKVKAYKPT